MSDELLSFNIIKKYSAFKLDCQANNEYGITVLTGPTGSGKTTLINCLTGMLIPDQGEIKFLGKILYSSSQKKHVPPEKRGFGYVFQNSALFPHMSVWKNIKYGYDLTPSQKRHIKLSPLIELFEISGLLERDVGTLSGGERQKVALARSLATSPQLLFLDEPLSSLDKTSKNSILLYLKRVWKDFNIPMIYVSHSISEILALAQNALVMSDGEIIFTGTAEEAFQEEDHT